MAVTVPTTTPPLYGVRDLVVLIPTPATAAAPTVGQIWPRGQGT